MRIELKAESYVALFAAALSILAISLPTETNAQLAIDGVFPPVAVIGQTVDATLEGKHEGWPVTATVDRDDVRIEFADKRSSVKLVVNSDAKPGIVWVRFHAPGGATSLKSILVTRGKRLVESEPNNELSNATELPGDCFAVGRLAKNGDLDVFRFDTPANQRVVFSVLANQSLGSPMDAVLQLVDSNGNILTQADDVRGLDPQLVYESGTQQTVYLRIFAFPETPNQTIGHSGGKDFVYAIRCATGPTVDHMLPLIRDVTSDVKTSSVGWELPVDAKHDFTVAKQHDGGIVTTDADDVAWQWQPNISRSATYVFDTDQHSKNVDAAELHELPLVYSGHIDAAGQIDAVRFRVDKGAKVRATAMARTLGFHLDSVLTLTGVEDGKVLKTNDDAVRGQYDAELDYTAKADGVVELSIKDLYGSFGTRHAYSILIDEVRPSVELTVAQDHITVESGKTVDVNLSIGRKDGFNGKLEFTLAGAPASVTLADAVSENKTDSAKAVTLKITAAEKTKFSGSIEILGRVTDPEKHGDTSVKAYPVVYASTPHRFGRNIWLTVADPPKKEESKPEVEDKKGKKE